MFYFCYTRTENEESAKEFLERAIRGTSAQQFGGFSWDATSGQRGLAQALRWTEQGEGVPKVIVIDKLSDLGRDVPGLVKQITALLDAGVSVHSIATGLWFYADKPKTVEPQVIRALAAAHVHYIRENRKLGLANAKAGGAIIGRPRTFTLKATRKTIERLTDAKDDTLPSTRDLAKAVGCGNTKASELLREYVAEKKGEGQG
jgi:DNA invertase Pin-like site-specific DNA recombinase